MGALGRPMAANMRATGYKIGWKDKAHTSGQMGVITKAIGSTTKCKEKASTGGQAGAVTMGNG